MTQTLTAHLDYSFAVAWHPNGLVFATGNQVSVLSMRAPDQVSSCTGHGDKSTTRDNDRTLMLIPSVTGVGRKVCRMCRRTP